LEYYELAPFPIATHVQAAEEHLGVLEGMWRERCVTKEKARREKAKGKARARKEAGVQFGDANEQQAEGDGIDDEEEDTTPILVPPRTLLYNLCGWEVKLAKEHVEGAGDNSVSAVQSLEDYVNGERKVQKRQEMEKKLERELARTLTWPYLAMEVHKLNEKYLH
jgi:hypothetical protein